MNIDTVLAGIDRQELAELALRLANIPSPTGSEEAMGEAVFGWLTENGFNPRKITVAPGRFNVAALLKGTGGGASLIFNAHMDTKYGGADDCWSAGDILPEYTRAWREGDLLFGHGVMNDEGPLAATFLAARAIRDGGVRLKGDLHLTAVVGEIGSAPVDEFQSSRYVGKGVGARRLRAGGRPLPCVRGSVPTSPGAFPRGVDASFQRIHIALQNQHRCHAIDRLRPFPYPDPAFAQHALGLARCQPLIP